MFSLFAKNFFESSVKPEVPQTVYDFVMKLNSVSQSYSKVCYA